MCGALLTATALSIAGCSDSEDDNGVEQTTGGVEETGGTDTGGTETGGAQETGGESSEVSKPVKPTGLGEELVVEAPQVSAPLPSIETAGTNGSGDASIRYSAGENVVAFLLKGINEIYKSTSDDFQAAGWFETAPELAGKGPDTFEAEPIVDAAVWKENMQYVLDVTANRTDERAILSFLDDARSKNYSVIDGLGPLTETYVANSGAYVDIPVPTVDQVLVDTNYQAGYNDNIMFAGNSETTLGAVYDLVNVFRQLSPASTSASKYIYSTPRPWRMTDDGAIDFLGTDKAYECTDSAGTLSTKIIDQYTTNVDVLPGLMCSRRAHSSGDHEKLLYTEDSENRRKDGAYPSGHTNAGYLAAMGYAYAIPQRFSEMLTRASELGESRIVCGMHSPVDVIGGRIHSTIVASFALNNEEHTAAVEAAYETAQTFFGGLADEAGMSLYDYAHRTVEETGSVIDGDNVHTEVYDNNDYDDHEANKALYRFRMTYGLSQDMTKAGQDPIVPEGAEALLKSRLPYLTDAQRRAVLYTTSLDSGYPILDSTNGWGRLDLVTAADSYGAFLGDVAVTMDASAGGFNALDWWQNDISGDGMLTKAGSGHLVLTGDNSFTGGTLVQAGVLEAESTSALGTGDLYLEDGTLVVDVSGALALGGNLTVDAGTFQVVMDDDSSQLTVADTVYVDGGVLELDFADYSPAAGTELTIVSGGSVHGAFDSVESGDVSVELEYSETSIVAVVQ